MPFRSLSCALILALFGTDFILGQHKNAIELKQCYVKDKTKFENCLLTFWKGINPIIKSGIPELNVQSKDPLFIDFVEYKDKGVVLQAHIKFSNITVSGASNFNVSTVRLDTEARLVTVNVTVPGLNATGNFTMKGNVLGLLPVDNSGRYSLNMTEVSLIIRSYPVQKGAGIRMNKTQIDFNAKNLTLKLYDLLEGDAVGNALNGLISENSKQLFEDLDPLIGKVFEIHIQNLTAETFKDIPAEAFFS